MIEINADCEWWVLAAVASIGLFVISELLPVLRPTHQGADEEEEQRVHGVVQFMTLIIRSRWIRNYPEIRDMLRFWREVVAEAPVPSPQSPVSDSSAVVLEIDSGPFVPINSGNEAESKKTD